MQDEQFTFFWDGPFSQWYPSYFELEEIEYNCAEQYMMAQKALLFDDHDTYERIMEAERPRTQKALGRLVDGFERYVWEAEEENERPRCWNIVWRANHAKFTQDEGLAEILFETAGTTLVEASPDDAIWGIGLAEGHHDSYHRAGWRGTNWLGEVLTSVRAYLMTGASEDVPSGY